MTSSRFDPGSTSVRPQKPWTSPFYGSMNGPGLKTLVSGAGRWSHFKSKFFPSCFIMEASKSISNGVAKYIKISIIESGTIKVVAKTFLKWLIDKWPKPKDTSYLFIVILIINWISTRLDSNYCSVCVFVLLFSPFFFFFSPHLQGFQTRTVHWTVKGRGSRFLRSNRDRTGVEPRWRHN